MAKNKKKHDLNQKKCQCLTTNKNKPFSINLLQKSNLKYEF